LFFFSIIIIVIINILPDINPLKAFPPAPLNGVAYGILSKNGIAEVERIVTECN
jgi:hypothetical protein